MTQAIDRQFTEKSGCTTFPVKNARHGLIVGVADTSIDAVRAEIERFTSLDTVAALTLFVPDAKAVRDWLDRAAKQLSQDRDQDTLPALTCVAQPSCEPGQIGFEAYFVTGKDVMFHRDRAWNLVTVRHDGLAWFHGGQVTAADASSVYTGSSVVFRQVRENLARSGCDFRQILRTWLYQGDIVGHEGDAVRYHELNRARSDFFENDAHVVAPYPASTGIGQSGTGMKMSYLALTTDSDDAFHNVALENPLQTAAYDYEEEYGTKSPKFSRAIATVFDRQTIFWISGTASILDSETCHHGDVAAQTRQTIENLRVLISQEEKTPFFVAARVYIKHQADYPLVRSICEKHLGPIPTLYVVADICRRDLLVEIEAVAWRTS